MNGKVLLIGYGRIGRAVSKFLLEEGFYITVLDVDEGKLEEASKIGLETVKTNVLTEGWIGSLVKRYDLVCTCLPGSISFNVLMKLLPYKLRIVDVSYFPEDYRVLRGAAEKYKSLIVVDAGVAPGLSNILAGRIYSEMGGLDRLEIYVGGLPLNPKGKPLGIIITWNPEDLIEEYIRPARIVDKGSLKRIDPLSKTGEIHIPKIGRFEYFASDGLRTLIESLRDVDYMVEYTLRYPGHIEVMKTLRSLGLMSKEELEIDNCKIKPSNMLALLFEKHLAKEEEDQTILYVEGRKGSSKISYLVHDVYSRVERLSSMARTTGYTMGAVANAILDGIVPEDYGLIPPENFGINQDLYEYIISKISKRNIIVERI